MTRSLIVLPDDSAKPILAAIEGASQTLRVKMFVFSDPALRKAIIAAQRRGVAVRVMLNPARRSGEQENEAARTALERAGIAVQDANPAFALTHEKSMVVDDVTAFVNSLNWTTRNLTETRDYAVVTTRGHDVSEIIECFEADWHRQAFTPRDKSDLVWCPGPGRDRICRFIDEARHKLFVQNERFQDTVIVEHLVRAARRRRRRPAAQNRRTRLGAFASAGSLGRGVAGRSRPGRGGGGAARHREQADRRARLTVSSIEAQSPSPAGAHASYDDPARWNGHDPRRDRAAPPQCVPGADHCRDRGQPARAR